MHFETERLILRPTDLGDSAFILKLLNTPSWFKYIGNRHVYNQKDAEKYIESKILPQYKRLGFGNYTIIEKATQMLMGTCGLYDREGLEGVDIGFAFLPEFEGKGFAFEAAHKIKALAKDQFKLTKINAITTKDNHASQKLLKKLGLKLLGTTHIPGDDEELLLYQVEL